MLNDAVEYMVDKKSWNLDEDQELEKLKSNYDKVSAMIDRYVKMGFLEKKGQYIYIKDGILSNTVLSCLLGNRLASMANNRKTVLDFGREHYKLIEKQQFSGEILWTIFCFSQKDFPYFACSYILAACIQSKETVLQDFFHGQMHNIYKKERRLCSGLQKITLEMDTLTLWTSDLDLESSLVYDYYLNYFGCEEAPFLIAVTICACLYKIREHMMINGGMLSKSIRGSMKRALIGAAQDMLDINLTRNSLTDVLRSHYGMDIRRLKEKDVLPGAYLAIQADEENFDVAPLLVLYTMAMEQFKKFCLSSIREYLAIGPVTDSKAEMKNETVTVKELEEKIQLLTQKNKNLTKDLDTSEKNLSHLQAETQRLKQKIQQMEEDVNLSDDEIPDISVEEDIKEEFDMDEAVRYLSQKRVLVIGGHERWVRIMQEYCPKWLYIIDSTRNLPRTQDVDFVLINIRSLSHGLFEKAQGFVKAGNIPKYNVSYNNIEQLFYHVYQFSMSLDKK